MDIIYFHSSLSQIIKIEDQNYDLTYSHIIYNEEKIVLTGYININLCDLQTKKMNLLTTNLVSMYPNIVFQLELEKKELHFMDKNFYDFFHKFHLNQILVDEKNIENDILIKFIHDYIFNHFQLNIKHSSFNIIDNYIVESVYICEKNEKSEIIISNYFSDSWKTKIKKFFDFSINLKKNGFQYDKYSFIKNN